MAAMLKFRWVAVELAVDSNLSNSSGFSCPHGWGHEHDLPQPIKPICNILHRWAIHTTHLQAHSSANSAISSGYSVFPLVFLIWSMHLGYILKHVPLRRIQDPHRQTRAVLRPSSPCRALSCAARGSSRLSRLLVVLGPGVCARQSPSRLGNFP
jgi:hypothetical protein